MCTKVQSAFIPSKWAESCVAAEVNNSSYSYVCTIPSLQSLTLSHHIMLCFVYMLKCVHACILCIVRLSCNCLLNVCDKCQSTYDSPLNFDLTWCIIQPIPRMWGHQNNRQKWHHFSQVGESIDVCSIQCTNCCNVPGCHPISPDPIRKATIHNCYQVPSVCMCWCAVHLSTCTDGMWCVCTASDPRPVSLLCSHFCRQPPHTLCTSSGCVSVLPWVVIRS